ncbi:MAG TPA: DUF3141 domain-containing protein, partial [Roseiarcus sp.]
KSPIVVFCSWGDDITPPQQALDWILDLYDDVDEIVAEGQTIIYSLHPTIGHLGIFVSGKVAAKEHNEFVSCMEMIEATPPGLYEAVITDAGPDTANRNLVDGKYLFRLEKRTLDDIRTFGVNSPKDDARFAALARLSEINLGLYRTFWQPWVRASVTEPTAEAMRAMHPNRLRFGLFSEQNPFAQVVKPPKEAVRANRTPISRDNPLLAVEKAASSWITTCLESWGQIRDSMTEAFSMHMARPCCRPWSGWVGRKRIRAASSAISCARRPPPNSGRASNGSSRRAGSRKRRCGRSSTCDCLTALSTSAAFACLRASESSGSRTTASLDLNSGKC